MPVGPKLLLVAGALALAGCITPHSMTLGQMAAGVGRGATEVGVFTGFQYGEQLNPAVAGVDAAGDPTSTQAKTRAFGLPSAEANLQYGFSDQVGLNVHASPAGLQPGLKLTLNKSKVANVALLPALGVGYASVLQSTYVAGIDGQQVEGARTTNTSFTFLVGLKFLFSHRSGFYAGVGYDLLLNNAVLTTANSATTDRAESRVFTLQHQIMAAVGLDISFGLVHLRPEVAFAVMPGIAQTSTALSGSTPGTPVTNSGGFGWALFPGFSLAVATPVKPRSEADEEEEDRAKRDGEGEDEAADENENPKIKARARRNAAEGAPKKRGRDEDEDEEKPKPRKTDDDD